MKILQQVVREALGAAVVGGGGGGGRVAGGFASTLTAGGFVPFNSVAAHIAQVQSYGYSYANTMQNCVNNGGRLIVNQCDPSTGLCTYKCQDVNGNVFDITQ